MVSIMAHRNLSEEIFMSLFSTDDLGSDTEIDWNSMASARKRTYQAEFLNYGFTEIEDKGQMKPQCVVCMKVLTTEYIKKNQLKKHLDKVHSHLSSKPWEYFQNLEKIVKRQRLESNKSAMFDQRSAAIASFEVAWLVARNKKPHTIGEDLIKPAAVKMADISYEEFGTRSGS
ncbi:protein FAM200B-like [Palaemon carinicauda]|uniref:protein FAM200B-like n=1 Tax=Palaemon carinicauda TaxID=392227 RepID=UPI0035B59A52